MRDRDFDSAGHAVAMPSDLTGIADQLPAGGIG
jgi:hypothetical protein